MNGLGMGVGSGAGGSPGTRDLLPSYQRGRVTACTLRVRVDVTNYFERLC